MARSSEPTSPARREPAGGRRCAVTGVSRYVGAHVAGRLAAGLGFERVIGIDATPPRGELAGVLAGVDFVRADIRSAHLVKVITQAKVDIVVHCAVVTSPARAGGRAAMKERNVIGTMQLLAACQQVPDLRQLVVKSSVAAYGASSRDPAIFTEDTEPRETPRGGYAKDVVEVEGYVRGFRRRRPDVAVTVLRFAPLLGPHADTTLTRYFSLPVVPTVLGRDPRLQFVHVDDALEVMRRSVVEEHPGVYNVAGPGVLLLSQAIRRAGRVPVPVPESGMSAAASFALRSGAFDLSMDQLDYLVHGRVVDITRLRKEFGYTPRGTRDAFDDFVRGHDLASVLTPDNAAAVEHLTLDVFRQVRSGMNPGTPGGE